MANEHEFSVIQVQKLSDFNRQQCFVQAFDGVFVFFKFSKYFLTAILVTIKTKMCVPNL